MFNFGFKNPYLTAEKALIDNTTTACEKNKNISRKLYEYQTFPVRHTTHRHD
jgi:hypothetical protein